MDRQQHEFLYRKINLDNKTSSAEGSIVSLIPVHNHQVVASPLPLPLPGVLTSAQMELMIIAKEENHTQPYKQAKG